MTSKALFLQLAAAAAGCLTGTPAVAEWHLVANDSARRMMTDLKAMIEAALDDAARRTKFDRAKLKVLSAESVTWSDGSLGCPEPGMAYTQALVPGYRIRVQAGNELLDYHAGRRGPPAFCPQGRSIDPLVGGAT